MNEQRKKLLDRLKKIQALSLRGVAGEAENAARMLAKMLAEHRMSMEDLDIPDDGIVDHIEKQRVTDFVSNSTWQRQLAFCVSEYFDCRFAYVRGSKTDTVVGHTEDIECFKYLFVVARRQVEASVNTAKLKNEINGRSEINDYRISMVMGFRSKLRELKREISDDNQGYAIVLADRSALVSDFVRENCNWRNGPTLRYNHNKTAHKRGTEIKINKGVYGTRTKRIG